MEMLGKIRRMHLRDNLSLHEAHRFVAQHDPAWTDLMGQVEMATASSKNG